MDLKAVYADMNEDLKNAQQELKDAHELIALGVDMDLPVAEMRQTVREVEHKIKKYQIALDKRTGSEGSE